MTTIAGNTLATVGQGKPSLIRVILGGISRGEENKDRRNMRLTYGGRFQSIEVWDLRKETTEGLDRIIMCTLVFFLFPFLNTS